MRSIQIAVGRWRRSHRVPKISASISHPTRCLEFETTDLPSLLGAGEREVPKQLVHQMEKSSGEDKDLLCNSVFLEPGKGEYEYIFIKTVFYINK